LHLRANVAVGAAHAGVVSRLADTLPAAEITRFEGAGHVPHQAAPDEYIEVIQDFIRRNAR
jgi:pimeloyl-ACP methyl ester carboxylesterase